MDFELYEEMTKEEKIAACKAELAENLDYLKVCSMRIEVAQREGYEGTEEFYTLEMDAVEARNDELKEEIAYLRKYL